MGLPCCKTQPPHTTQKETLHTCRHHVLAHAQATSRTTDTALLTLAASQKEDLSVAGDVDLEGDTSLPLRICLDLWSVQ